MSNVPMTRPEEVLAAHETNYFHSSTFVELNDGRILHAANTTFTTSEDGGITWSEPFERRDTNGDLVGGGSTSLVKLSGNGVGLAAARRGENDSGTGVTESYSYMVFWRSEDGGETWEPPVRATSVGRNSHAYQDVLLRTSSGRIVLPLYGGMGQTAGPDVPRTPMTGKLLNGQWTTTSAHFWSGGGMGFSWVVYSDDDGRTWRQNEDGELVITVDYAALASPIGEPTVTEVSPGKLLMFFRTKMGRVFQAWSHDDGTTWTRPQGTSLAATTTPAQIRTIPSTGHLLVVWNQENEEDVKRGFNRTRLSSAISRNGGSVWEFFQNIESMHEETRVEPGPFRANRPAEQYLPPGVPALEREGDYIETVDFHGRWSYPSVLVLKDRVLVAYTYSHYEEHPETAELVHSRTKPGGFNQKLKVLPLTWFYGGKEPADNPFLPRAHDPAQP